VSPKKRVSFNSWVCAENGEHDDATGPALGNVRGGNCVAGKLAKGIQMGSPVHFMGCVFRA
jgi:hypothetical protein